MRVERCASARTRGVFRPWISVGLPLGLLVMLATTPAHAQLAMDLRGASAVSWSPLARIGDLPRNAPLLTPAAAQAFEPDPRIGLFWSGRNPAGLAWEAGTPWAELGASAAGTKGSYRRPLDPGASALRGLDAIAWKPIGTRTAMAGHVSFADVTLAPGTFATTLEPYASVPFTVTDSTRSDHSLSRVALEGAAGWRVGRFGIGASIGIDATNGHSRTTGVPRTNQASRPAVVLGIARNIAGDAARVGLHGRWTRAAETAEVFSITSATVVTRLNGFAEPLLFTLPAGQSYYRRREADGRAAGLEAAGRTRGWDWAAHAEAGRLRERQWSQRSADPPTDTWNARSINAGAELKRELLDARALLTVTARWERNTGTARLADEDSAVFRAVESVALFGGDLRWRAAGSPWGARVEVTIAYDHRDRGDAAGTGLRTRLHGRTTRFAAEFTRELTDRVSVAGGLARTAWDARGSAPKPIHYPRDIRPLAGGEAAFEATPSRSRAATFAALLDATASTSFRLGFRADRLGPRGSWITYDLAPEGTRTEWGVEISAILR